MHQALPPGAPGPLGAPRASSNSRKSTFSDFPRLLTATERPHSVHRASTPKKSRFFFNATVLLVQFQIAVEKLKRRFESRVTPYGHKHKESNNSNKKQQYKNINQNINCYSYAFPRKLGLDARIGYFGPKKQIPHPKIRISSNSEVYMSAWSSKYREIDLFNIMFLSLIHI